MLVFSYPTMISCNKNHIFQTANTYTHQLMAYTPYVFKPYENDKRNADDFLQNTLGFVNPKDCSPLLGDKLEFPKTTLL